MSEKAEEAARRIYESVDHDGRIGMGASEIAEIIDAAFAEVRNAEREQVWNDAIAVAQNPALKNGLWDKDQDRVAQQIQERVVAALIYTRDGKDYRGSVAAIRKGEGQRVKNQSPQ